MSDTYDAISAIVIILLSFGLGMILGIIMSSNISGIEHFLEINCNTGMGEARDPFPLSELQIQRYCINHEHESWIDGNTKITYDGV